MGSFTSQLTGLYINTTFYVRAYAINRTGIAYGDLESFSTTGPPPAETCPGIPTITDVRDGTVYPTVLIGEQCWLAKNLGFETTDSWCYDNDPANCLTYGRLYRWEAIMNGATTSNNVPSGVQGICPPGWHIPSKNEWTILVEHIGLEDRVGYEIKATSGWHDFGNGNNSSGFNALPAGSGSGDYFSNITRHSSFWSSTMDPALNENSFGRNLQYSSDGFWQISVPASLGYSLRCLKD